MQVINDPDRQLLEITVCLKLYSTLNYSVFHDAASGSSASTLIYLINAQDRINEQNRIFSKIINRAGRNKRAGRAKFEAIINKQGAKTKNIKGKTWQCNIKLNFTVFTINFTQHSLKFLQFFIEI